VRVVGNDTLDFAGVSIAGARGYFEEEGLEIEIRPGLPGEDALTALQAGHADVAVIPWSPALFATHEAASLRLVAAATVQAPGRSGALVVSKRVVESQRPGASLDLTGKRIGLPAAPGIAALAIEQALAHGGGKSEAVQYVDLEPSEVAAALGTGTVDVAYAPEPYASEVVAQGLAMRWRELGDLVPNHPAAFWVYSEAFAADQPEAARRFMTALLRGVRDYELAFTHNIGKRDVIAMLESSSGTTPRQRYDEVAPVRLPPDGAIPLLQLRDDIRWLVDIGALSTPPDLATLIDTRFVDYANARLGAPVP
jgi:NitT/TauT family transport system substrate-binding protein